MLSNALLLAYEIMNIRADADTLTTLKQMVERLQIFEATEESASLLNSAAPPSTAAAGRQPSTNKSKKKEKLKTGTGPVKCGLCGRTSHGAEKILERIHCPAKDQDCSKCGIKGHFGEVCRKSASSAAEAPQHQALEEILLEASVSFGFATATESSLESYFCRVWRPTKER